MERNREKNVALILAGGLGNRMGDSLDFPKQFYKLNNKPLIVHTLEIFESHPEIDDIYVVCLESWEKYLRDCLDAFGMRKTRAIVPAGRVRHESVHNGLNALRGGTGPDDIVVVHDGVRPFITPALVSEAIAAVREHGSAMTSVRSSDSLLIGDEFLNSTRALERDSVFLVQTPQCYRLDRGLAAYEEAAAKGIVSINCCELFVTLGQSVHLINGLKTNIKLTTAEDIDFLHALHAIYRRESASP